MLHNKTFFPQSIKLCRLDLIQSAVYYKTVILSLITRAFVAVALFFTFSVTDLVAQAGSTLLALNQPGVTMGGGGGGGVYRPRRAYAEGEPSAAPAAPAISKQVMKEWKKRLRATDPAGFKMLVEDKELMQRELLAKTGELATARLEITTLQDENAQLKAGASIASAEAPPIGQTATRSATVTAQGIVYKVQIGSYAKKVIEGAAGENADFTSSEPDANGNRKFYLGNFNSYWDADAFKKHLRTVGLKDAFLVSFKDGIQVSIKDVLENVASGR
jgi:hypothetical protein